MWYGQTDVIQKVAVETFIESLNNDRDVNFEPRVAVAPAKKKSRKPPKINVKIATQVEDAKYSVGKALSRGSLAGLVKKATDGLPADTVAVILAAKDVKFSYYSHLLPKD
ncbi:hypothetical protein RJ640_028400 [Escallonia rubra]|uniref:Uncharacterized protein n=1 Tax=Escallonia rubra TaxID=112253 RepID=A0AA88UF59_9ASTE|nr:hypothetical protein RJ640_028400 [Escallonia rubra]